MTSTPSLRRKQKKLNHYTFPYVQIYGRHYPLIPIKLKYGKKQVNTFALLDSGASVSVFRPEIAKALGIKKMPKGKMRLGTANGSVNIYMAKVRIEVEKSKFITTLGFANGYSANFNIIGREGFFHRFSICFNEIMKTVIMVPLRKQSK